ncbi:MAG: hypothetical protein RL187_389 [Actinomycetota bacterium]
MRVIVGVAGGIAAYKAVSVVREFVTRGADVTVIPTASALKFVGLPTWEAISRNPVPTDLFEGVAEVRHVALGHSADLVVVAPATAHTLASMAAGLAGDLLGTTLLATRAPVLVAPAMHTEMWEHASVQANLATLVSRGISVVGPESGRLTGDDAGVGRMSEPVDIVDAGYQLVAPQSLRGKKVLISAGGTREALDPVRFIGNRSSGAMGVALAVAARARGAEVTLVHAAMEVSLPGGVTLISAPTVADMAQVMISQQPSHDIVIMAAAVADWVPESPSADKITKSGVGDVWSPALRKSVDILAALGDAKPHGQYLIGFAAETESDERVLSSRAHEKLEAKKADAIVLNRVGETVGFGEVETDVTLFFRASPQSHTFEGTKSSIAGQLLDALP